MSNPVGESYYLVPILGQHQSEPKGSIFFIFWGTLAISANSAVIAEARISFLNMLLENLQIFHILLAKKEIGLIFW